MENLTKDKIQNLIESNPIMVFMKGTKLMPQLKFKELSMGMSNDYLSAIEHSASYLRIGSKIFGERS